MISQKKLDEKVKRLKALKRDHEDLETQIKNLEDELKSEMLDRGVSELKGEDWIVTWTTIQSNRFDQSAFRVVHPDLFESFKSITESKRFSVK